jgi:hypothetical protein
MHPPTRIAKPARPARRGRARASISRPVRLPLPFLALCGLLLLLFALAEFVRPPAVPPQAAPVAQTAKSADGEAAKRPALTEHDNRDTTVSGPDITGITGPGSINSHTTTDNTGATDGTGGGVTLTDNTGDYDTGVNEASRRG